MNIIEQRHTSATRLTLRLPMNVDKGSVSKQKKQVERLVLIMYSPIQAKCAIRTCLGNPSSIKDILANLSLSPGNLFSTAERNSRLGSEQLGQVNELGAYPVRKTNSDIGEIT